MGTVIKRPKRRKLDKVPRGLVIIVEGTIYTTDGERELVNNILRQSKRWYVYKGRIREVFSIHGGHAAESYKEIKDKRCCRGALKGTCCAE